MGPDWECELCANARNEETHIEPRCMICPRDNSLLTSRIKSKKQPADFDLLSVMKPTEGCQWAHVLCATWHPEVQYTNGNTFKAVEGVSTIADERWDAPCGLCMQEDGATVQCSDCGMDVHVSCAWLAGYKLGFEITLVKPGKREVASIAKFKDEAGVMTPGVWCKNHDLSGRVIHDMFEVDPEAGENALHVYTSLYKTIPSTEGFALLRKAQRLDVVEDRVKEAEAAEKAEAMDVDGDVPPPQINGGVEVKPVVHHRTCLSCGIDVSPMWHGSSCHRCWFAARGTGTAPVASLTEPVR